VNSEFPSGEDWDEEIGKEEEEDWDAELKKGERPSGYLLFTGKQGRYVFGQADIHDFPKTEKKKNRMKKGERGSRRPEDPILEEAVKLFEGRGLQTEEFYF
jgi:hypothetical protein